MRARIALVFGILGCATIAEAGPVVVIGDGAAVASELRERGRRVLDGVELRRELGARAPDVATPGDDPARLAEEGRAALYARADFAGARAQLSRAADALIARSIEPPARRLLARVQLDLGVALLAAGDTEGAEREIALALRLEPGLSLDRALHGPDVRELVDRLRAAPGPNVSQPIRTRPSGARLWVDGTEVGEAPLQTAVPRGSHVVVARLGGRTAGAARFESTASPEPWVLALPRAEAAASALEALEAGDDEAAAPDVLRALDVDRVVVVRRGANGLVANVWSQRGTSRASAADAGGLVRALEGVEGAGSTSPAEHERRLPWAWIGVGAAVVVAGVAVAVIAASSGGPADRILIVEPHQP